MSAARAIVSRGPLNDGGWKIEDVKLREVGDDELLVRIVASGICHTDILFGGLKEGPGVIYPSVKGHEGAGYVEKVGKNVSVAQAGDPVLLSFTFCNECQICQAGHPGHCVRFGELNFGGCPCFHSSTTAASDTPDLQGSFFGQSSFASKTIVKSTSVVNVKGLVSDEELKLFSPLGCGIQTGSGTVINVAQAGPQDTVAVLGLGGVGLSAIMAAKLRGCKTIIGIDKMEDRMGIAKELGATHTINTSKLADLTDIITAVQDVTDGYGTSVTVDTTGFLPLIQKAMDFTRLKGKLIQVGSTPFDAKLDIHIFPFMVAGKQYIGAVEGDVVPPKYVPQMIEWYRKGQFPVDKLVKFYKADDWQKAVDDMHHGHTVKAVITW
ncbi:putative alcohol dehydrogenase protein [Neofusicoccum parvum UCRNP2]|uniref:Alcohol dehydrogenase protein n=2 Tax=Neofusicoccum parvum TaxID=310453 RepID=A0ACB5SLE8_9PEZI|nr:putative alcohol dehydrogenase protein [Neofusicoccum parvum UCRNP2]GME47218.1 putative alcohol dehydrogenase protein [Neofusicoccum parvum]